MNGELVTLAEQLKTIQSSHAKDAERRQTAFETTLSEISTALSDLVSAVESKKEGEALGKAIAAALKGFRIEAPDVKVQAPSVTVSPNIMAAPAAVAVHVAPTPVHHHVDPTPVHFNERPAAKGWKIKFEFSGGTVPTGATMTRID